MNRIAQMFRGPWCIAVYTWREGIRKKILVGFLILSLLVIFGSSFLAAFLSPATVGDVEADVDMKLIKDICVTTISLFGVLITIFVSASMIPGEVDNKVIYTVLSKPVRRVQYLLGKFIGIQFIIIVNLSLMTALFFFALLIRQGELPTLLLWSTLLTYFEFLIISTFTFAISCTSTSSVLPILAGLFFYITGNLTEYLNDVFLRSGQSNNPLDLAIGYIAKGLHEVLPNLQNFSLKMQIIQGSVSDPPADAMIPNLILYSLAWALSCYVLAFWIFRRKEL
jgi:ABC-type transport system involved in multi-copper enzyme maturation permease subunit